MFPILKDYIREHKAIKQQNKAFKTISKYITSPEQPFIIQNLKNKNIIWQLWEAPTNKTPTNNHIVEHCLESIEKYKWDGFQRKLLNFENSKDQVLFPDFVYDKLQKDNNGYTLAAFSDILRLALLCKHGGIWVDATIIALRPLKNLYLENIKQTGFSFQRSDIESLEARRKWRHYNVNYFSWNRSFKVRWLSSLIIAGENRDILNETLRILLLIWKNEEYYPHYFTAHIIYDYLSRQKYLPSLAYESDVPIHYLQKHVYEIYDTNLFNLIANNYPIQKMTWKVKAQKIVSGDTFFNRLFSSEQS